MAAKISKLEKQFDDAAGEKPKNGIFDGIAIFVNGYTGKVIYDTVYINENEAI